MTENRVEPVALVTGAAGGIGRATSARLAAAGWRVAAADFDRTGVESAIATLGSGHRAYGADVREEAEVARLFAAAEDDLGPITALICLVGGTSYTPDYHPRIADTSLDEWLNGEALNSRSAFLCVREYFRRRTKTPVPNGRIVLTASAAAQQGGGPTGVAYASFKAAVLGLMKTAAMEGARHGITCNAISPGAIDTPALSRTNDPGRIDQMKRFIPVGRIGRPEEIAATAAFLVSPDAGYLTAATIDVNGGSRIQ